MQGINSLYHTLLEDSLVLLRNHLHEYGHLMNDSEIYRLCELISNIERAV